MSPPAQVLDNASMPGPPDVSSGGPAPILADGEVARLRQAPAQLRYMMPHGLLSSGRIMLLQIGQDVAMLGKRLVLAARDENNAKLMTDEWRMERVEKLLNNLMRRGLNAAYQR